MWRQSGRDSDRRTLSQMSVGKSSRQARLVTTARTAARTPPACSAWTVSPTVNIRTTGTGCPPAKEAVTVTVGIPRPSNFSQGKFSLVSLSSQC